MTNTRESDELPTMIQTEMKRSEMATKSTTSVGRTKQRRWFFRYISGQRLAQLAIVLLLLAFSISSYVGSAKNHQLLTKANKNRSTLIVSVGQLTDISKQEIVYIEELVKIVERQNEALTAAGQKIIVVPPAPGKPYVVNPNGTISSVSPSPTPSPLVTK